jgi:ADP-ribosyl-[dinitrogen reductase] hydrolase
MTVPRPLENSYWVHPDLLLAGEYPGGPDEEAARRKLSALLDRGVDCFLDLTNPGELPPYGSILEELAGERGLAVEYHRLPIRDFGVPDEPSQMVAILDRLDAALAAGRTPFVHCWGGVGRTGTVIGCHLARRGLAGDAALARLAELWPQMAKSRIRPQTPETEEQREYVRSWSEPPVERTPSRRAGERPPSPRSRRGREHFRGCLLGGAVGDALGAPVEFMSLDRIRSRFGAAGIRDYAEAYGRAGAITDDTQMTLFTAEGLLRATVRGHERGVCHPPSIVHHAYLRWLWTQGEPSRAELVTLWEGGRPDGWLVQLPALHSPRAPGNTCLSALRERGSGSPERPLNDSKGCGGVMRVAPVGLMPWGDAFSLGCETAAITHGHPTGFLSAGFLAQTIRGIIEGAGLPESITHALRLLEKQPGHEETTGAVRRALEAVQSRAATAEVVESLGGGWIAEEALAIAIFCALAAGGDFETGIVLAVNHGGDSDSTGAMTGNLLGALLGESAIPGRWLAELELRREIESLADDLSIGYRDGDAWRVRYPGW